MSNNNKFEVDINLLKKFDRPGPRYTSYPTVPHFHNKFGPVQYKEAIEQSNLEKDPAKLSLYFHIPFCPSRCYYCACNTHITKNRAKITYYLNDLKKEIKLISTHLDPNREVIQLHWGGGTPTYLTPKEIENTFLTIKDFFSFANKAEISVEADPRRSSSEHLQVLRKVGFNRISFGVQDFNPQVQQAVNRVQPEELTKRVIQESLDLGFESINIDLIYGLPYQTVESYKRTLEKVIKISPHRLAVFNFAHVPWMMKHQKLIKPETLPPPEEKLLILKTVIEHSTEAGYTFIGMDHFAKKDDELSIALREHTLSRNFQGYTTKAGAEVFAMGVTSISQLRGAFAQNTKDLKEYREILNKNQFATVLGIQLSEDDRLRRELITELMCNNRIIKSYFENKYQIQFDDYFRDSINKLDEFIIDGLVENSPEMIQVSEPGRLIIRNIAMVFDQYLEKDKKKEKPIYSRTV
jgi:oxygen-independent coproporphyrinogen-3 oxidase